MSHYPQLSDLVHGISWMGVDCLQSALPAVTCSRLTSVVSSTAGECGGLEIFFFWFLNTKGCPAVEQRHFGDCTDCRRPYDYRGSICLLDTFANYFVGTSSPSWSAVVYLKFLFFLFFFIFLFLFYFTKFKVEWNIDIHK